MKPVYERENLNITEFDTEDVITTSAVTPTEPTVLMEQENAYRSFRTFEQALPGNWFNS